MNNPFIDAYVTSDFLGKAIFIGLLLLSICSWVILFQKAWLNYQAKKYSFHFAESFQLQKQNPLSLDCDALAKQKKLNPFLAIYMILKKNTLELLNKNKHFSSQKETSYLSQADISYLEGHLSSAITSQTKYLEKNLFILATIVSLGPFLGLLGTVWGILTTFSNMTSISGSSHQAVLGGLSLALATTVLGLVDAIPALIGYNYLKNSIRDFETDMEEFAHSTLSSVGMQYRKADID
jgi:biopolymer transport protein TolQ